MTMLLLQGLGLVSTMISTDTQQYYKCFEKGEHWEIHLVKEHRMDYIDTVDFDDMGDWISYEMKKAGTHGVLDIKLFMWDYFLQARYEQQEERRNSE